MHPEPGGHYAAHTEPAVLVDDLRAFYAALAPQTRGLRSSDRDLG
jgi:hypothetical protein